MRTSLFKNTIPQGLIAIAIVLHCLSVQARPVTKSCTQLLETGLPDYTSSDPFKVLGIPRSADLSQARTAFRKLALKFHPDQYSDADLGKAVFVAVTKAYRSLQNELPESAKQNPEPEVQAQTSPEINAVPITAEAKMRMQAYQRQQEAHDEVLLSDLRKLQTARVSRGATFSQAIIELTQELAPRDTGYYLMRSLPQFLQSNPDTDQIVKYVNMLRANYAAYQNSSKPPLALLERQLQAAAQRRSP